MGLNNLISHILTLLLAPNKVSTTRSKSDTAARSAECAVCLSRLEGGTVLPCRHEFHADCIERWLAVPHFKNTCPICRFCMEEYCCGGGDDQLRRRQQECFTEEMVIWFSSFHVAGF